MANIYLPLHVWDREFDSRLVLAYLTACNGDCVFLGHEYNMAPFYSADKQALLFRAGGPLDQITRGTWHKNISESGGIVITQDEEGVNNLPLIEEKNHKGMAGVRLDLIKVKKEMDKVSSKAVKDVTYQIGWSPLHRAQACHKIEDIEARSIAVNRFTSHSSVRFDLLGEFGEFFQKRIVTSIRHLYDNYILILDNFSVDHRGKRGKGFVDPTADLKQVGYTESEIKAIIEKTFENSKIESKARADFAQLVIRLATNNPDMNFVFRPHPVLDATFWGEHFSPYRNISIVEKGPIHAWIYGAKATMHSGCTTGLEASAANRPTFDVSALISPRISTISNSLISKSKNKIIEEPDLEKQLKIIWRDATETQEKQYDITLCLQDKSQKPKMDDNSSKNIATATDLLLRNSKYVANKIYESLNINNPSEVYGSESALAFIMNESIKLNRSSKTQVGQDISTILPHNILPNGQKSRFVSLNEINERLEDAHHAFKAYGIQLPRIKAVKIAINTFLIQLTNT